MTGTERVDQIAVIPAAGVFVSNKQRDGCAGGLAFKDTGEDFDGIGFLPLRDVARGAWLAPIEVCWMSSTERARPGGQPSTTQPIAGPWLSPNDVTVKTATERIACHGADDSSLLHEIELDAQFL